MELIYVKLQRENIKGEIIKYHFKNLKKILLEMKNKKKISLAMSVLAVSLVLSSCATKTTANNNGYDEPKVTIIKTTVPVTTMATMAPVTKTIPMTTTKQATTVPATVVTTAPTTVATTVPATVVTTAPTTVATTVPTTVVTTAPTTVATTVPTTVATTVPTTVATTVPTTMATTVVTTAQIEKEPIVYPIPDRSKKPSEWIVLDEVDYSNAEVVWDKIELEPFSEEILDYFKAHPFSDTKLPSREVAKFDKILFDQYQIGGPFLESEDWTVDQKCAYIVEEITEVARLLGVTTLNIKITPDSIGTVHATKGEDGTLSVLINQIELQNQLNNVRTTTLLKMVDAYMICVPFEITEKMATSYAEWCDYHPAKLEFEKVFGMITLKGSGPYLLKKRDAEYQSKVGDISSDVYSSIDDFSEVNSNDEKNKELRLT